MRIRRLESIILIASILGFSTACGQLGKMWDKDDNADTAFYQRIIDQKKSEFPILNLNSETFADCQELQGYVRQQLVKELDGQIANYRSIPQVRSNSSRGVSQSAPMESAAPADESKSYTNVQEQGVDEGDSIKIGENHLFAMTGALLQVTDRQKLQYLGSIDLKDLQNVQLYVEAGQLVVIGTKLIEDEKAGASANALQSQGDNGSWDPGNGMNHQETVVSTYALNAGKLPTVISEKSFTGAFHHHRMLGGHLILTFDDNLPIQALPHPFGIPKDKTANDIVQENPVLLDDQTPYTTASCTSITKSQVEDFDFRITRVSSIDTHNDQLKAQSLAILGSGDHFYMSSNSLYVVKQGSTWYSFYENPSRYDEILIVSKVKIDEKSGEISFAAVGGANGRIKDQWAMKEYPNEVLSIATSTGQLWGGGADIAQNHLFLLRENSEKKVLETIGSVTNFGTGEDIRSVRYIGNIAYVVTCKKTDPLFAFDLTSPEDPKA